ncbi:MAG: DUF1080 domain-containing protein [Bacteroidota bacterium]|nr:DUF1080 domain-containing protein [Bacteroidota bacterium]
MNIQLHAQEGDPKLTEVWKPVPKVVAPGAESRLPPSDAIVLFDGKDLSKWQSADGSAPKWEVKDGAFTVKKGTGDIQTKDGFHDMQLHIEWRSPAEIKAEGQSRGNSGIFLQSNYELQVLDSYNNPTYSNGQAGSIYKQTMPLVNAARKPGEWQTYDIIYKAPEFNGEALKTPATVTVFHNGVLIQHNTVIKGTTPYIGLPQIVPHADKMPLKLQDHGDAVSYRNIWIREL